MSSEKFVPFHAKDIPDLSGYVALVTGGITLNTINDINDEC